MTGIVLGMKMVHFLFKSTPSKLSSSVPCQISPERGISILSIDIIFDKDFPSNMHVNEDFLTAMLSRVTTFRVSDWLIVLKARSGQLPVTCLRSCRFQLRYYFNNLIWI